MIYLLYFHFFFQYCVLVENEKFVLWCSTNGVIIEKLMNQ